MLSNGILCFTFPMIMTIVLTVADSLAAKGAFSNIGGASNTSALIRDGITSILISRFLMDLCKLGSQEHGASGVPENELTTHVMIELSATSSALPSESCDRCYDPEHGYTSK
ncbi:hypothetical protein C8Q80DRAFT_898956 [Daedaleopsis nitida]|nr:hypothetical protein C8Q80DRAFT_898956 [Daedaleopsis nitida]